MAGQIRDLCYSRRPGDLSNLQQKLFGTAQLGVFPHEDLTLHWQPNGSTSFLAFPHDLMSFLWPTGIFPMGRAELVDPRKKIKRKKKKNSMRKPPEACYRTFHPSPQTSVSSLKILKLGHNPSALVLSTERQLSISYQHLHFSQLGPLGFSPSINKTKMVCALAMFCGCQDSQITARNMFWTLAWPFFPQNSYIFSPLHWQARKMASR